MGKSKKQPSDGEEQETTKRWGRARDRQVMGKSKRQVSDEEERETGK
jgi:hypothetical protein